MNRRRRFTSKLNAETALGAVLNGGPVPWETDEPAFTVNDDGKLVQVNPPKVAYLSPEDAEAVSDVVSYYFNAAGTPMVDAWTTAGRWVSLPQAFVEVGY